MADPGKFKRALYPPSHSKGPVKDGDDVVAVKRAISRAGFFEWKPFDDTYNEVTADAVREFQRSVGLDQTGNYGKPTHQALRAQNVPSGKPAAGQDAFDDRAAALYKRYLPPNSTPDLGPTHRGGESVLMQDLTHATSRIPLYPAFDDAFDEGVVIIAPEDLTITKESSSMPGDACYAEGKSGIQWWFGHLVQAPGVGTKLKKGAKIGFTCPNSFGGGPHVHVAVNVEKLWGAGKQLTHKTTYQHGAPLIGEQLAAGRPLAL